MKTKFEIKKQKSGDITLMVRGDLCVQAGYEFKGHLSSLLSVTGDVIISLEEIQTIDVSAIQLLYVFKKTWKGKSLTIMWPQQGQTRDLILKTNIEKVLH
jgi:anti-anti-sigma regulatory factor